jgi:hypothetical protein
MNYEQVSAFLTGTLGTIIINAIINYVSKNREQKQLLRKITYERKLEVGEAAIAFYSYYKYNTINLRSALQAMIESIKFIDNPENQTDRDLNDVEQAMERLSNTIVEMFGPTYQSILSMNLYFDIVDSKNSSIENITAVFIAIAQARALGNELMEHFKKSHNEVQKGLADTAEFHYNKVITILPSFISKLEDVFEMLGRDVVNSANVINSIKKQLKVFMH